MDSPLLESRTARLVRYGALALGATILVVLVRHTGVAVLLESIRRSGWILFPVIGLWGIVYACNARAWQLLVPNRPAEFTFIRAFALSVHAFALNFATPFLSMGGEPFRVAGATRYLGKASAAGSVVGFRFLHGVAHTLVFLVAVIPAAILLPHTPVVFASLTLVSIGLILIVWFLISQHRSGVFERSVAALARIRWLRPLAVRLERHAPFFQELDLELTAIHREEPRHFHRALAVELLGRVLSTMEYALILYALGLHQSVWHAFAIANMSSFITNLLVFIPYEMGTKEGGVYAIFGVLGMDPAMGMTAAILSRVREFAWLAIGLACGFLLERTSRAPTS